MGSRNGVLTMARFGLRSQRWWLVGVGFLGFVSPYSAGSTYLAAAGTRAAQISFGHTVTTLGVQLAYLIPLPLNPETPAGYLWWKGIAWMTLIFAAWGVAAGTGLARSDEEHGLMETWLASPLGRARLLLSRTAGFTVAAVVAVALTALGIAAGISAVKASVTSTAVVEQALPLLGISLVCFGVGVLVAQQAVTRRRALGAATGVLLALYAVDALARVNPGVVSWSVISPFHLADLTTAVVPGGHFDGAATGSLFAIAAVLIALSALTFRERDLQGVLLGRARVERAATWTPSANPLLGVPVMSTLWQRRWGLPGWVGGSAIGAALVVSLARGTGSLLVSVHGFQGYLQAAGTSDPATAIVSSIWFGIAALILAAYAITQVSHWAADDAEGRLEMEIAQPVARWRVVAERFLALTVVATLIAALGSLVTGAMLPSQGVRVSTGTLVIATALLVPLTLTFGALGALIIARFPRAAVPALGVLAVAGFYLPLFTPLFKWPDWTLDFSLFHLYGTPLTTGVFWTGLWIMVGIIVVGFGGALAAMRVRDVGR